MKKLKEIVNEDSNGQQPIVKIANMLFVIIVVGLSVLSLINEFL